jgi:hypothetical protein
LDDDMVFEPNGCVIIGIDEDIFVGLLLFVVNVSRDATRFRFGLQLIISIDKHTAMIV